VTPPDHSLIGKRLTLAVRDSLGTTYEILGELLSPNTIRKHDGSVVEFDPRELIHWRVVAQVTGKAGTGAPLSIRVRELESAMSVTWPTNQVIEHGKWLLRTSLEPSLRGCSALPTGDRPFGEPGNEIDQALQDVTNFYQNQGMQALIEVPLTVYAPLDAYLDDHGWQITRDEYVMVADTNDCVSIPQLVTQEWRIVRGESSSQQPSDQYPAHNISLLLEGEDAATARISFTGNWGVISDVSVRSEFRRRGIGRELIQATAHFARDHDCHRLVFAVDANDPRGVKFGESVGFRPHHRDRYRSAPSPFPRG